MRVVHELTVEDTVHIKGLSDLARFLDELPDKIKNNVMRGSMRAGMEVIKDAAVALAPEGKPSDEGARLYGLYPGALRDSIRLGSRISGDDVIASVRVGSRKRNQHGAIVWYAHIIEFTGAAAHDIVPKVGGSLFLGGVFRKVAHHPGMRAHPFMRPAFDANARAAVVATAEYMKDTLATKNGLDTSAVIIEAQD